MTIILDHHPLPEKGPVDLAVQRSFEIKVTAEEARRQVKRWLRDEISLLIDAEPPTLVVGEQVVWRVPVSIRFPHTGRAGLVGAIDVEVAAGAMNNTPARQAEIVQRAEEIAARQPPFHLKEVPEPYRAANTPPAPKLRILADGAIVSGPSAEQEQA